MDYKFLKEKFFLGETTRDEEDELRRYLMGENLPADALEDRELMLAMLQPVEYDCSEAMNGISAMIGNLAAQESAGVRRGPARRSVVVRYLSMVMSVAAALLLIFMLFPRYKEKVLLPEVPLIADTRVDDIVTLVVSEQSECTDTRYVGENVQRSGNAEFLEQCGRYKNDTFNNPEDVADHIEVLLAIFSDAAVHGIKEQKEHLKQLIVLNNAIYE